MKDRNMNIYKINHAKKLKTSKIINNKHIWLSPSGVVSNARKKEWRNKNVSQMINHCKTALITQSLSGKCFVSVIVTSPNAFQICSDVLMVLCYISLA